MARNHKTSVRRVGGWLVAPLLVALIGVAPHGAGADSNGVLIGVADWSVHYPAPCKTDLLEEQAMEKWQGKPNTYSWVYQNWELDGLDAAFACLTAIWEYQHAVPLIIFKPPRALPNCAKLINNRAFDAYLLAWSARMKYWLEGIGHAKRRALVSLLPEANLSSNPSAAHCWHVHDTPAEDQEFKDAYHHVVRLIRGQDPLVPNPLPITDKNRLQWGWLSLAKPFRADLAPDPADYDWVGIDSYECATHDFGGSPIPGAVSEAASLGKPVWLDQIGIATQQGNCGAAVATQAQKNTWLSGYFAFVRSSPSVKLIIHWNNNGGGMPGGDNAVFSRYGEGQNGLTVTTTPGDESVNGIPVGYHGYSQYHIGILASALDREATGANGHPGITDAEFRGL